MAFKRYNNSSSAWTSVGKVKRYSGTSWANCSYVKGYISSAWKTVWPECSCVSYCCNCDSDCECDAYCEATGCYTCVPLN